MKNKKTILAIDTSSIYLSIALQHRGKIYTYINKVDNRQSENIIPQIKQLLNDAKIVATDIAYIVYNQGPGSFTGLRIGLSVSLGIALGIKANLIPISAFAMYALQAYEVTNCERILVGLDARLNQLYLAGINAITQDYFIQPQLVNPADIVFQADTIAIGDGFSQYKQLLPTNFAKLDILSLAYPGAIYLLKLANSEKFVIKTVAQADLFYLRNKVALNLNEQQDNKINNAI